MCQPALAVGTGTVGLRCTSFRLSPSTNPPFSPDTIGATVSSIEGTVSPTPPPSVPVFLAVSNEAVTDSKKEQK